MKSIDYLQQLGGEGPGGEIKLTKVLLDHFTNLINIMDLLSAVLRAIVFDCWNHCEIFLDVP